MEPVSFHQRNSILRRSLRPQTASNVESSEQQYQKEQERLAARQERWVDTHNRQAATLYPCDGTNRAKEDLMKGLQAQLMEREIARWALGWRTVDLPTRFGPNCNSSCAPILNLLTVASK